MTVDLRGMAPLLQVFDMPASLRFYCDVLGFEVIGCAGEAPNCGWALLKFGDTELMLNTAYEDDARPASPDPARMAAHEDTTLYFGCPDLHGLHAHLRSRGIAAEPPARTGYGFDAVGVRDPDGYGLCFFWPATPEAIEDWRRRYGFDPAAAVPHR